MSSFLDAIILEALAKKVNSPAGLEKLKKQFARQFKASLPKNYQLLLAYRRLVSDGKIHPPPSFARLFLAKPVRTLSGVTPLTVLLKPYPCPGHCLYCPDQAGVPKSYLNDEPAVLRAEKLDFDPARQVDYRLKVFKMMGHRVSKIELIILGGTFSFYPRSYRCQFLKTCFETCNQTFSPTLSAAQRKNESADRRIVGLTIETRPDLLDKEEIIFLRKLGVTRVEVGVQSLDPAVLRLNRRGHGLKAVFQATRLLRDNGFKVCYHLMPGLPGSTLAKEKPNFVRVFTDPRLRPDFLKIYPCVVVKDSPLFDYWQQGKFTPWDDQTLVDLLTILKQKVPPYVRINRLGRDIPLGNIVAGFHFSHIRELVKNNLDALGKRCRCLRCREIRGETDCLAHLKLKKISYQTLGGREIFLEFVDNADRLYASLRLRLPQKKDNQAVFSVLKEAALIRELHTYGRSLAVGEKAPVSQHQGLGERLLRAAEKIARAHNYPQIAVISGVGVRDYYRRFGYRLSQTYLVKKLT